MKAREVLRFALMLPLLGAMLFLSAGTLDYWQGWAWLGIFAAGSSFLGLYLARTNPALLERRTRRREQRGVQRLFQYGGMVLWPSSVVLSGLDHRFGWSHGVPWWLSMAALAVVAWTYELNFEVLRANTYAGATIGVEAEQKVVSTGPYAVVRHPMYAALAAMAVAMPLALGSWVVLAVSAAMVGSLVMRLLDEEKLLRSELPGYAEYCARVRWRLAPGVF